MKRRRKFGAWMLDRQLALGVGFIIGSTYTGTLAALGREAIERLSGGAL
jgi:hypothetical protein